ncbi:hypothetical protein LP52_23305 [Streptomonospora alba]|uniref:Uncharacterized protein n=1 Tax=Streptomonospora alba TaxID=183763 RepID=A0A0C2FC35_9ACTN|nr:hypothetical protein [Streptomonospora alba]KIH96704.1 hypothetical protein LP52_23305 [Streptomonospora alba]
MAQRFTDEMVFTLQCVSCQADLRTSIAAQVVIGHYNGGQLAAFRGQCARQACGRTEVLQGAEDVLPLEERIAEWEAMG